MLRIILTHCILCMTTLLFSQNFTTKKTSFFKSKSSIEVLDNDGNIVIILPRRFKKNRHAKGLQKIVTVNGNHYAINKQRRIEKVFDAEMNQIAAMENRGKKILLFDDGSHIVYERGKRKMFDSKNITYTSVDGLDRILVKGKGRQYQIFLDSHHQSDSNLLLAALSLHQQLEYEIKKEQEVQAATLSTLLSCN